MNYYFFQEEVCDAGVFRHCSSFKTSTICEYVNTATTVWSEIPFNKAKNHNQQMNLMNVEFKF